MTCGSTCACSPACVPALASPSDWTKQSSSSCSKRVPRNAGAIQFSAVVLTQVHFAQTMVAAAGGAARHHRCEPRHWRQRSVQPGGRFFHRVVASVSLRINELVSQQIFASRSCFSLPVCAIISKAEEDAKGDSKDVGDDEWKARACRLLWNNDGARLAQCAPDYLTNTVFDAATKESDAARSRLFDVLLHCRGDHNYSIAIANAACAGSQLADCVLRQIPAAPSDAVPPPSELKDRTPLQTGVDYDAIGGIKRGRPKYSMDKDASKEPDALGCRKNSAAFSTHTSGVFTFFCRHQICLG